MQTVAIFPLWMVREVLKNGKGGFDDRLCKKFGYFRQMRMTGAVVSQSGITNVSVGSMRPDAYVGYSYEPRGKRFEYANGVYYKMPKD